MNYIGPDGYTALMNAACSGYPKMVAYLLQQGADATISSDGLNAYEIAEYMKQGFERSLELNPSSAVAYKGYTQRYTQVVDELRFLSLSGQLQSLEMGSDLTQ